MFAQEITTTILEIRPPPRRLFFSVLRIVTQKMALRVPTAINVGIDPSRVFFELKQTPICQHAPSPISLGKPFL